MKQILIQESNFERTRKLIRGNKGKEIILSGTNDDINRKILEKEKINILLINLSERKDRMKQRDSGFNHVLARLAKKNNVSIGINLDEILQTKTPKEKTNILARLKQNIKLCSKNKLGMAFVSQKNKRDVYDLKALGSVLGMPTWMTKNLNILLI